VKRAEEKGESGKCGVESGKRKVPSGKGQE